MHLFKGIIEYGDASVDKASKKAIIQEKLKRGKGTKNRLLLHKLPNQQYWKIRIQVQKVDILGLLK